MTTKTTKAKHVSLHLRDLKVHPRVQRKFRPGWARYLRDNFDPDKFGEIAVVQVGDDYFVFDGQHRCWAAREALGENQQLPCLVYSDMTTERQADLFLGRNQTKALRAMDKFKVALIAGPETHRTECRIAEIVRSLGLEIAEASAPNRIRSVAALVKVFGYGENTFLQTLLVIREAWAKEADAYDGNVLKGIGYFLHHFGAAIPDHDLARKLQRSGGPNRLIGGARDRAKAQGVSVERAAAEWVLAVFNKGKQVHYTFEKDSRRPTRRAA